MTPTRRLGALNNQTVSRNLGHELPARILIVEDNPVNAKIASHLLKLMGYTPGTRFRALFKHDPMRCSLT